MPAAQILNEAVLMSSGQNTKDWKQRLLSVLVFYSGKGKGVLWLDVSMTVHHALGGMNLPSKVYRSAGQSMAIWILIFFTRPHKVRLRNVYMHQ